MKFNSFEWDEHNLSHATRHSVSREEIEEVILSERLIRRGKSGVYIAYGQTMDGRYVIAIFEYKRHGLVRPFSARPMTHNEKRRLKRFTK